MASQTQQEIDSILDAALDALDQSDSDDDDDPRANHLNACADASATTSSNSNIKPDGPAPPKPFGPPPPSITAEGAELAASLENMMEQFQNFNSGLNGDDMSGLKDAERVMDEMFRQMMGGMPPPVDNATAASSSSKLKAEQSTKKSNNDKEKTSPSKQPNTPKKETSMDATINNLLNNIQQPLPAESIPDATITSLLNDISTMSNCPDANPIIDTVMKQLLDKELMYQPMKEVCSRFPEWLVKNKDTLSEAEYGRYRKQYEYFQKICKVYEVEPENFDRLMELMQDIQE